LLSPLVKSLYLYQKQGNFSNFFLLFSQLSGSEIRIIASSIRSCVVEKLLSQSWSSSWSQQEGAPKASKKHRAQQKTLHAQAAPPPVFLLW
jgi:hypothetical protein